ncbi:MAG TPA: zinc ribbon domain-containing protein [Bryobacteraceae bacterium]|jgi:hypothetical protein
MILRSIGLPELLVLLFVIGIPVGIAALIVMLVRKKGAQNSPPNPGVSANAFCTVCGNGLAPNIQFCGRCGARRS